jgi:3-deoxy-manno-octulosonate cytidylyltransferase (CMP-KDO synthetase)
MVQNEYYTLINGDEILLNPKSIDISINLMLNNVEDVDATILAVKFTRKNSPNDFKIVRDIRENLLYISRNDIPSDSRNEVPFMLKAYHLMTFKKETVDAYSNLSKSYLESLEDHEHLRLIENGYNIRCGIVDDTCISLDTLEDLDTIIPLLKGDELFLEYAK